MKPQLYLLATRQTARSWTNRPNYSIQYSIPMCMFFFISVYCITATFWRIKIIFIRICIFRSSFWSIAVMMPLLVLCVYT